MTDPVGAFVDMSDSLCWWVAMSVASMGLMQLVQSIALVFR